MAKISPRIERSYKAYIKYRKSYTERGYGLDRGLTIEEYKYVYKNFKHAFHNDPKIKHIARTLAKDDVTFTRVEAKAIRTRLKTAGQYDDVDIEAIEALRTRYSTSKSIYSLELTAEEAAADEQQRRQWYIERGKEPPAIIRPATARTILFNQLRDAGLSYKDAERVVYG